MKKIILGLSALALMAVPRSASATCAGPGSSFEVCASLTATAVYDAGSGKWTVRLVVYNLFTTDGTNGVSHHIKWAGLGVSQSFTAWTLKTATIGATDVSNKWKEDKNTNGNLVGGQLDMSASTGASDALFGCGTSGSNGYKTCYPTESTALVLTFEIEGAGNALTINSLGWHSGDVDGTGCSMWANTNSPPQWVSDDYDAGKCGGSTVPEPVSMVLLGTGLAGIGALRRRRKGLDIENA